MVIGPRWARTRNFVSSTSFCWFPWEALSTIRFSYDFISLICLKVPFRSWFLLVHIDKSISVDTNDYKNEHWRGWGCGLNEVAVCKLQTSAQVNSTSYCGGWMHSLEAQRKICYDDYSAYLWDNKFCGTAYIFNKQCFFSNCNLLFKTGQICL